MGFVRRIKSNKDILFKDLHLTDPVSTMYTISLHVTILRRVFPTLFNEWVSVETLTRKRYRGGNDTSYIKKTHQRLKYPGFIFE